MLQGAVLPEGVLQLESERKVRRREEGKTVKMEGKVLLPSEIMAFLDCAKDPIDLYEDALVVFRINLEYANDDFLAGIIIIEYAFKLQSYSHIQEAYNYLQDCEIESAKHSSINSVSIIGVIKNVRLNLLILEHKWSRAETCRWRNPAGNRTRSWPRYRRC